MSDLCNTISKINTNRIFIAILTIATLAYADISFVNHYLFKTYSLDLGAYTKCLYDFIHGGVNDSLVYRSEPVNCFASHFDLYLLLFAPFVYVFGTYTLLVIQVLSLLAGAWGIYKLIGLYTENRILPLFAVATFLSFFGVYHSFTFDYHSNVVATMLIPWFFYFFKKRQYLYSDLFLLFILIAKENLSLFMAFVCLGLIWDYRKDKKSLFVLLLYILVSLIYFFLINSVVMPYLTGDDHARGFIRYAQWGDSYGAIIVHFLQNPLDLVDVLWGKSRKIEFFICLSFSGGITLLLKPNYLVMTIPLIAQKMLSRYYILWSVYLHYNVEFAPIVVVACFVLLTSIKKTNIAQILALSMLVSTLGTLFYTIECDNSWYNSPKCKIFNKEHYRQSRFDVDEVYSYMKMIPTDASVCASSAFVPHLCLRKDIYTYHYKKIYDTDYMLIYASKDDIGNLLLNYTVEKENGTIWLLRKKDCEK